MKKSRIGKSFRRLFCAAVMVVVAFEAPLHAQSLINIDFGVAGVSRKTGFAGTGQTTNDYWNPYRHYDSRFVAGMKPVPDGRLSDLKYADGANSKVSVAVRNAPGVWGNSTGDSMFDTYMFAPNGSNIVVTLNGLEPGRYHVYLYGHADADVQGEQNSIFSLRVGTNSFGPLAAQAAPGWKASAPWQERQQYIVFRDVTVAADQPVVIEVAPGPNGLAVLNGLQIISRGTGPPQLAVGASSQAIPINTNLLFRDVEYVGKVTDTEARFNVTLEVESLATNEISGPLFEGDLAVLPIQVPEGLRIVNQGNRYLLFAARPGRYALKLDVVAKITRLEPWNQISFTGPAAAIASVTAQAGGEGVELQLLSGTQLEAATNDAAHASGLRGFLGADRVLSMRWQSKAAEIARKSLVTVDTTASAQITPTVIKFNTQFHYEILQAGPPRLAITLPGTQALTKLQGEQIRDWQIKTDGDHQLLTVEFIKPVEKDYKLALFSEQPLDATAAAAQLIPPQPLEVERESGSFTISTEGMVADLGGTEGLRQVNAPSGALAAYRFYGRPFTLTAKLKRIEPVVNVADRVTARLEESRLLVTHSLALKVEKAGIYAVEMTPGLTVANVGGEGIEDWKVTDGRLRVNFSSRLLGERNLEVQLEQANKEFPAQVVITPLVVAGAARETADIGAASAPGIRLKTAELTGLREMPATTLASRSDELLAYHADQADWKLTLASERLAARVVAEVFNLVTIGDGLVGGSATIRYGIINQGVQEFEVKLPAHWKNVEFTGPNIRRKDHQGEVWTIALQDKAWSGYTLVVTYDYQFDPKHATLDAGGAHALNVERETGSLAITTAGGLKLEPQLAAEPLRLIDQTELSDTDRALITRSVLLAYRYTGNDYKLQLDVMRHDQAQLLNAVADRTQLTTVLTEAGEMLTEASFMVKNNDKQFQKFKLPADAKLWGCYVDDQPVKAEQDGEWLLVSLPREANRDQAFAVDIKYAEQINPLKGLLPQKLNLQAPATDVPNTYAEWELFAPPSQRLSSFGGSMTVAHGTTYGLHDAWQEFTDFYEGLWEQAGVAIVVIGGIVILIVALVINARKRGSHGVLEALVVFAVLAILAGMMLPALSKAKSKAVRINASSNLKQIGLAARLFAGDHQDRLPSSFEEMKNEIGNDKILIDPESGQEFIYVGAGKKDGDPNAIIAYSPVDEHGRVVAMADGSVQMFSSAGFEAALQRESASYSGAIHANRSANFSAGLNAAPQLTSPPPPAALAAPALADGSVQQYSLNGATNFTSRLGPVATGGGGAAPTVAGIKSIRIDIPRIGHAFNFTKVLNVGSEPLSIRMSVMRYNVFRMVRMTLQVLVFITGLIMVWRQRTATEKSSFWMAVGSALAIASACTLFIAARALHLVFIAAAPTLLLVVIVKLARKFKPRKTAAPMPPPVPPVVLPLLLCGLIGMGVFTARAEDTNKSMASSTNTVSILSASYVGRVGEHAAELQGTLNLSAPGTNQTVNLFGDDVALEEFTVKSGAARLVRDGNTVGVLIDKPGEVVLEVKLLARLVGDVTRRRLAFGLPPALASRLTITIAEPDADVEFPTAVSFQRKVGVQETGVEAIIGSSGRVDLQWTPRVKRAAETAATVFCQNTVLVTFGGGVINTRATLDYQVTQGELRQAHVRLPEGQRLLRVEGESIRTWELKQDNGEVLVVDLLKGVSPGYRLTVETETLLDKLPARTRVAVPHALEVKRENGLLAIRGGEELNLTLEGAQELQRVDAAEFARVSVGTDEGIVAAYRFLKPDFQLVVKAEPVQPQLEAIVWDKARIGPEQIHLSADVDYTIKRAGVFALKLTLPESYKLETVEGNGIAQWVERKEDSVRVLEVLLKERTTGRYSLHVELSQAFTEPPKTIVLAGVLPWHTQKLTGFISVSAEQGVAVKATAFDGLAEIPAAALPGGADGALGGVLAYKFIATDSDAAAVWKLSVATEAVESWVRAEVVNLITVSDTLVNDRAIVRYDIQNAPVKEFRLKVPAAYKNLEITGANIRRRDQTGDEWRVELQNTVSGTFQLVVSWEQAGDFKTNGLEVAGLQALGVERETGELAILAKPPLQVTAKKAGEELAPIDARELPAWAGVQDAGARATSEAVLLSYRYLRPGWQLALEVKRFQDAAVLQALVDNVHLTTVIADDGQMMTEMTMDIHNNGRQDLELKLPDDAKVWSAFVGGQPVRPSQHEGKLLLPLERSGADDSTVSVEVTYIGAEKFPRSKGKVDLISPALDMPFKNARWELYLPPDYDYGNFEGSMTHEAEASPVYQSFSLSEYSSQESGKKAAREAEVQSLVSGARMQQAAGNLLGWNNAYSEARRRGGFTDRTAQKDLKDIEKDLRKAQSSNLIQAQQAYSVDNFGRLGGETAANAPVEKQVATMLNYDADVAEQQWTKLQQAQELGVTQLQPLRVNLPTRGLRHVFSQVLQTEVRKPMTIRLTATSTKTMSWPKTIGITVVSFLGLWALVAIMASRKHEQPQT